MTVSPSRPFAAGPDTFAVVIAMIVITYVVAVALTQPWGVSIVLVVQVATVWSALRTSKANAGFAAWPPLRSSSPR